ncbi:MAG: caspase family protein [Geminicoccaceae bacterium]
MSFTPLSALVLALLAAVLPAGEALATQRALLIAVSNYPDERMRLQGPGNDATLLYGVLTRRGFAPGDIKVLADTLDPAGGAIAVAGSPTRQAILQAFDALVADAQPGDEIFVAMSGHGTQQPAKDVRGEPDGLDELFLPLDVGRWDASVDAIDNAIVDDEIGRFLDRLRAKDAKVWLVMDSCHSGTGTRAAGDAELIPRWVSPESLGVPPDKVSAAAAATAPDASLGVRSEDGVVAFFAAQSDELAYELALPARTADAGRHGLLSYYVAQGLARGGSSTYLDVAQLVRAGYDEAGGAQKSFPTPLFEGDLSAALFGDGQAEARWPAQLAGDGRARLDAGRLHGLREGAEVLLRDAAGEPAARGTVERLGLVQSELALTWTAAAVDSARLLAEPVAATRPDRFLVELAPDLPAPVGEAIAAHAGDFAEAGIVLTPDATDAELSVRAARGAVWFVPHGDQVNDVVAAGGGGLSLELPPADLAAQLADGLRARAASYRLAQLGETFAATPAAKALRIELGLLPRAGEPTAADPHPDCAQPDPGLAGQAMPVKLEQVPQLRHCDTLFVSLKQRGKYPIDVGVFYVDSLGATIPLPDLTGIRLQQDDPPIVLPLTVATWDQEAGRPASTGLERLVVVGLKRTDRGDRAFVTDFAKLLGLAPREHEPTGSSQPFLTLLAAAPPGATRAAPAGDPREDGFVSTIYWRTVPF